MSFRMKGAILIVRETVGIILFAIHRMVAVIFFCGRNSASFTVRFDMEHCDAWGYAAR